MLKRIIATAALLFSGLTFAETPAAPAPDWVKDTAATPIAGTSDPAKDVPPATGWPSTPEEKAHNEQLARWLKQCLDFCAGDEQCKKKICRNTWAHSMRCALGDRLACGDRDRDLADIERLNAQRRNAAPQTSPQDTLLKCLQDTAARVVTWCRNTNCDTSLVTDIIAEGQKMQCGYTAIQPIQPPALTPNLTNCMTSPTPGGGWITSCY